jgi:outer membrane receptor for Fe3+-dicitrate
MGTHQQNQWNQAINYKAEISSYNLTVDKFTTPGIRYEDIKLNSLNYGTNDVSRAGTTLAKANKTNVWIPGLEFFKISDDYNIFTSVHKGFSRNQREKMLKTV